MYLLDTNVLSELVKKKRNDALAARLKTTPPAFLNTAGICVMELRYGALRAPDGTYLWAKIQAQILSRVNVIGFAQKEALQAAEILNGLHVQGRPIGLEDVLIAAIAISNGLAVVTANTKHFRRIPELHVENWLL